MSKQSDLLNLTDAISVSGTNVGIGTSSPAFALDVNHASDNGLARFTSGDADAYITISDVNSSSAYNKIGVITHDMYFNTNNSERMRIDSVGRVTMPYQPAFRAGRNQGSTTAGNRIVFPNGYSNIGSNYNSTTGIFTAPVSGSYYFHTQLFTDNNSSVQVQMRKNDTKHIWTIYSGGGYGIVSLSGVIELSTSDYVDVLVDAGSIYGGGSNSDCQFSGYLIG